MTPTQSSGAASGGKALIAGALGIVGRNLAEHLLATGGWEVVGISRGEPMGSIGFRQLRVDLTDERACREALASEPGITHLFYAARAPAPDLASEAEVNLGMLRNLLETVLASNAGFRHVCLVHGTKWYGSHLGPYKTPAKEDDARHFPPNAYYDQLDYVSARQAGERWTWSTVRPHIVCGFSLGYPHNIVSVLGVYAAVSKELGLPLRFPGSRECFEAVCQATDARLLGRAMAWAGADERAANRSFNIVNGDVFRWKHLWAKLAEHLGMENGGVQTISLARMMADKEPVWRSIVDRHGLQPLPMSSIANWAYGDMTLNQGWDHISSPMASRRAGFDACIDTEAMFLEHIDRYRDERIIPAQ